MGKRKSKIDKRGYSATVQRSGVRGSSSVSAVPAGPRSTTQSTQSQSLRSLPIVTEGRPTSSLRKLQELDFSLSLSKQEIIEKLLVQLEDVRRKNDLAGDSHVRPQSALLPTERAVMTLHKELSSLGLSFPQIRSSLEGILDDYYSGRYDSADGDSDTSSIVSASAAIRWLCLHVATSELPALLTEGAVRDEERTRDKSSQLQVLRPPTATSGTQLAEDRIERNELEDDGFLDTCLVKEKENETYQAGEPQDNGNPVKEWVLENYALVEKWEEEHASEDDKYETPCQRHPSLSGASEGAKDLSKLNDTINESVSQDTLKELPGDAAINPTVDAGDSDELSELQTELSQLELDLKDEASNYLRSKAEIKHMKAQVKQLRKRVAKLKSKQQNETRVNRVSGDYQQDGETPLDPGQCGEMLAQDDGNEDQLTMFDIFDQYTDVEAALNTTEPTQPCIMTADDTGSPSDTVLVIPDSAISKSWTGAVPKSLLLEWCRKEKISLPRFHAQYMTILSSPPLEVKEEMKLCANKANAEHYLSMKALYQIQPDRPLYKMLPPFYRDLWQQWLVEARRDTTNAQEAVAADRQAEIDEMMLIIRDTSSTFMKRKRAMSGGDSGKIPASWEDDVDDTDESPPIGLNNRGQRSNRQWKDAFTKRVGSVAYQAMLEQRKELPMSSYRAEFLEAVNQNAVTIISAETGAGKTTQCPQFLLEDALMAGRANETYILCTQPRRIAAVSTAERVSEEMAETHIGRMVGYQIRLDARRSDDTKLLFCTTGIVLRLLVDNPLLLGVSHVIVDEVHERQWQVDILLVFLRNLVAGPRRDLKIILMSATLNTNLFGRYFGGAPLVSIPGRTFPVSAYNLEHILEETGHVIEADSAVALPRLDQEEITRVPVTTKGGQRMSIEVSLESPPSPEVSAVYPTFSLKTRWSMDLVDETVINYDLIEDVLQLLLLDSPRRTHRLTAPAGADVSRGSVLIFLPGKGEIQTLTNRLLSNRLFGPDRFEIIPLHSSLSAQDQRLAFRPPRPDHRKIIISTNIAETSVTIPDVVIVIDSGRVRELTSDEKTGTPKLKLTWCSRASVSQRSGRAGRVQPGLCLKLFSSRTERCTMLERSEPELLRIPLEEVCLSILAAGSEVSCREILRLTPESPSEARISSALNTLVEIGALSKFETPKPEELMGKECLTALGRFLAKLPLHPRLGKMLVYGALFQCIDPVTTIAACLSTTQGLFSSVPSTLQQMKAAQIKFQHATSDFLTYVNVFNAFQESQARGDAYRFCKVNYLNQASLREAQEGKVLFLSLLSDLGLVDKKQDIVDQRKRILNMNSLQSCLSNKNGQHEPLVHSIICSGMFPNVAQWIRQTKPNGRQLVEHKSEQFMVEGGSACERVKYPPSRWVCFYEKFGSAKRVTVSAIGFVHPLSILLFCSNLDVRFRDRCVIAEDWIELQVAPKTGFLLEELRRRLQDLLQTILQAISMGNACYAALPQLLAQINGGIVELLE